MAAAKKGGLGKGLDSLIPEKPKTVPERQDKDKKENGDAITVEIGRAHV